MTLARSLRRRTALAAAALLLPSLATAQARQADPRLAALKAEAVRMVDADAKRAQEIVDMLFSFSELGFEEMETMRYLTGVLEKEGFTVQRGVAGMPSGWVARWGSGKPVITLGSDVDGIPQASQKPGVAYRAPLLEGGPGHGEGHNSGQAVNVVAAIAVKKIANELILASRSTVNDQDTLSSSNDFVPRGQLIIIRILFRWGGGNAHAHLTSSDRCRL